MQGWRRASLVWCGAVAAMAAGMCVAAAASAAGFERRDVEFDAAGTTLRGWLYVPAGASGPVPAIGMCHGRWAVKEMWLEKDAEVLAEAGLAALVYDNRNLGASDGEPRRELDPVRPGPRRPPRDHLCWHSARGRQDTHRRLGVRPGDGEPGYRIASLVCSAC